MSGTDATGIPARDGDGNTISPPIAPAPVNPVAPPAPLAQDVSDTVILTAIGFFFLLYAAWVRSRAERPSVSYTKVVMEVAWTGHNLQNTKTN